jgi:hypothetical protein
MGKIKHVVTTEETSKEAYISDSHHSIGGTQDLNIIRTATLVVAASDSSAAGIAQADYQCDGTADDVQIQAAIDAAGAGKVVCLEGTYNTTTAILADNDGLILEILGTLKPSGAINAIEMTGDKMNIYVHTIDGTNRTPSAIFNKSSRFCTVAFETIKDCNYGLRIGDTSTEALTADNTWRGNEIRDCIYSIMLEGYDATYHAEGQAIDVKFVTSESVAPTKLIHAKQNCKYLQFRGSVHNQVDAVNEIDDDVGYNTYDVGYVGGFEGSGLGDSIRIDTGQRGIWVRTITPTYLGATTLNGAITGNSQNISGLGDVSLNNNERLRWKDSGATERSVLYLNASNNLVLVNDAAGGLYLQTDNNSGVGNAVNRLVISGNLATAVATWSAVTHAGMVMSDHLTLHITDTDGTAEGDIWYDASEDKLKFKTAAGVETITSA